jgi:hypothetical protein
MSPEERFQKALRSPDPGQALRTAVLELHREGQSPEQISNLLEQFVVRTRQRADYRESDEDALADSLDALAGWCHPNSRLLHDDQPAAG